MVIDHIVDAAQKLISTESGVEAIFQNVPNSQKKVKLPFK